MTTVRFFWLPLIALTLVWSGGGAPASAQPVRVDPATVLRDAAAAYTSGALAERIEVTHKSDGVARSESLFFARDARGFIRIDLGDLTLWLSPSTDAISPILRISHAQDKKAFVERAVDEQGLMPTLAELFPPIPLPQLALITASNPAEANLLPFTGAVTWTSATLDPDAVPPTATARGASDRATVELTIHASTGRLIRYWARVDERVEFLLTFTAEPAFDFASKLTLDTMRRRPVESIGELRPRAGDTLVGDPLPPLLLLASVMESRTHEPTGPCAILFLDHPSSSVTQAWAAMKRASESHPTLTLWPVFVTDMLESRLAVRLDETQRGLNTDSVYHTFSRSSTVERFSESTRKVLVVVDADSTVCAIMPLGAEPDAPASDAAIAALSARILAALPRQKPTPIQP